MASTPTLSWKIFLISFVILAIIFKLAFNKFDDTSSPDAVDTELPWNIPVKYLAAGALAFLITYILS